MPAGPIPVRRDALLADRPDVVRAETVHGIEISPGAGRYERGLAVEQVVREPSFAHRPQLVLGDNPDRGQVRAEGRRVVPAPTVLRAEPEGSRRAAAGGGST